MEKIHQDQIFRDSAINEQVVTNFTMVVTQTEVLQMPREMGSRVIHKLIFVDNRLLIVNEMINILIN